MAFNNNERLLVGRDYYQDVDSRGIGAFIFDACDKFSNRICQIDADSGEEETFGSVKDRSIRVAIAFQKLGIKKGEVVLFCSNNVLDNVIPILACFFIGASVASLDPSMSVKDIKQLINIVRPKTMVIQDITFPLVESGLKEIGLNDVRFVFIGESKIYPTIRQLVKDTPADKSFRPIIIDDIKKETASIYFSSGTTGLPKGICLSHYGLLRMGYTLLQKGIDTEVLFHVSTMYWISAMNLWLICFFNGSHKILTANTGISHVLKIIQDYKITLSFLASSYVYLINTLPTVRDVDVSSVKAIIVGGSYVPAEQIRKANELLGKNIVFLAYGMTENSGFISFCHLKEERDFVVRKPGSAGTLVGSLILKVVDTETNRNLCPNEKGELRLKSSTLMLGYFNKDSSDQLDEQGFLKTGDLGYVDEEGCLYIVDRIKEMFKYQSWHILPASIETEIYGHEAIKEAIVFGVPHEADGDRPAACVVLKDDFRVTEEELLKFINERVTEREKLRGGLKIINEIPKSPSGKALRNKTRDLFLTLQ